MAAGSKRDDMKELSDILPLPDLSDLVGPDDEVSVTGSASSRPMTESGESRAVAPEVRIRRLPAREMLKIARTSANITERRVVERVLGRSGWEQLLRNPNLTPPEVAVIARKGTVPRPLIEQICHNRRWLEVPTVRRALLSNPKLTPQMIRQVLRTLPAHELKMVPRQSAYPRSVRMVASRMVGKGK
jgi:hypothetical protein